MKCPVCMETDLVMSERSGIEVDYCPKCRGVWLDRGELDKIIERSMAQETAARPTQAPPPPGAAAWGHGGHYPQHGHGEHGYPYHHKKSFWREIFD